MKKYARGIDPVRPDRSLRADFLMGSLILCYAAPDEAFARRLGRFLEANLALTVSYGEGLVRPDFNLIEAAERALSAEAALVLLSPDSVPKTWDRKAWEPVFFEKPGEFGTPLGFVLVRECRFPELLRRRYFFDASRDPPGAARAVKRWLLRPQPLIHREAEMPAELDELRLLVADEPGVREGVEAEIAYRFAGECAGDFEAVYCLDCTGRSRAGVAGDLGQALGLRLPGTLERNRMDLVEHCRERRILFVLAGVSEADRDFMNWGGKASVIFTDRAVFAADPQGIGAAVGRFQGLAGSDPAAALRLGWRAIGALKADDRFAEIVELLERMAELARGRGDEAGLARVERERFWMQDYAEGAVSAPPHSATDAVQLVFGFALS